MAHTSSLLPSLSANFSRIISSPLFPLLLTHPWSNDKIPCVSGACCTPLRCCRPTPHAISTTKFQSHSFLPLPPPAALTHTCTITNLSQRAQLPLQVVHNNAIVLSRHKHSQFCFAFLFAITTTLFAHISHHRTRFSWVFMHTFAPWHHPLFCHYCHSYCPLTPNAPSANETSPARAAASHVVT